MLALWRTIFLALLVATLVTFGWAWRRVAETDDDVRYRGWLRQAHELDARVHLEVVKSHKGIVSSYDPLVLLVKELSRLAQALQTPPPFLSHQDRAALVANVRRYRGLLERQRDLVESFKTENAVLRNSVRYFPVGSQHLADQLAGRAEGSQAAARLNDLLGSVLLVTAFRDRELVPRAAVQLASFAREAYPELAPADANALEHLLAHAHVIVERKPAVDGLVGEILALPTNERIDHLMRDYALAYETSAGMSRRLRTALFVLTLLSVLAGAAYVITRLSRSRIALENARATLETALSELRLEQEKQNELAELKSRFVSMASHEFRTPLSVILSSVDLLDAYGMRWSEDKKKGHMTRVQEAAKGMKAMLDDVLLIGRSDAGGFDCKRGRTDVGRFCEQLVESVRTSTGGHHHFAVETRGDLEGLMVDPRLLEHVLGNLLTNAVKYSEAESTVVFEVSRNHALVFGVRDEGIGIPPGDLSRLFDSFYRGRNVGGISGTGLGLAIAKKAVEAHGGSIEVESTLGVGTRFTVRIPFEGDA